MSNNDNEIKDLIAITELANDNIFDILFKGDEYSAEYVWCWKERIKEEMENRWKTGMFIPIKDLNQYPRGIYSYPFDTTKG